MSSRATTMVTSPIAEAKAWLAQRTSERPLLDLSQAAPSYATAPVIAARVAEVAASADGGAYAPPMGLPSLKEAFSQRLSDDDRGTVRPEQVLPTAGCNQAFCVTVSALADPGDEVVVPLPYYFNHRMWLEAEGITPRLVAPDADLVPSVEAIDAAISDRTRAVVLVSPGNPTGVTIPSDRIDEIAELTRARGVALILDETYRNFRSTDDPPHRQFSLPDWSDHVISLHSFSKDLAIPGHRVGAIVAGAPFLAQAAKLLDCVAICAPRISQEAAVAGILHAREWQQEQAARIAETLAVFRSVMADRPGGVELLASGAFFGWVRHPFDDLPVGDVVKRLVLDHDVLTIPGTAFMPHDDQTLRLSFANLDTSELHELADRLAE